MLYHLVKIFIKIGFWFYIPYFRKLNLEHVDLSQPTIVVANHPNSFMDALILATQTPYTFKFMVRGDIFKNKWANKALRSLNMLPIHKKEDNPNAYRDNEYSFVETTQALKEGYKIIIFPEGRSFNDWTPHPIKKGGISKIIEFAKAQGVNCIVQPFTITYNSFKRTPKAVLLEAYPPTIPAYRTDASLDDDKLFHDLTDQFNQNIKENDAYIVKPNIMKKVVLFLPMLAGIIINYPIFKFWSNLLKKKTDGTVFYDSVLFGALLITYPLIVVIISVIIGLLFNWCLALIVLVGLPLSALALAHYKNISYKKSAS